MVPSPGPESRFPSTPIGPAADIGPVSVRLPSLALDVPVTVRLAERAVRIGEIRGWTVGSVVELPAGTGRTLDLVVDDRPVATGTPVTVDGRVGVRVTATGGLAERIALVESHR